MLDRIKSGLRRVPFLLTTKNPRPGEPVNRGHVTSWIFNPTDGIALDSLTVPDFYDNYDATLKRANCAEATGSGEQLYYNGAFPALGINNLTLEWAAALPASPLSLKDMSIGPTVAGTPYTRFGVTLSSGSLVVILELDGVIYSPSETLVNLGINNTAPHTYCVEVDRDGFMKTFVDGSEVVSMRTDISAKALFDAPAWDNYFRIGAYGSTVNGVFGAGTTKYWNVKITIGSTVIHYPLQGSGFDIAGGGYHLTNTNADLLASQDDYFYNENEGFDLYLDDATSTDYVYVPYVSGVPVVASIAGYTKQSEHPAGYWSNNSECWVAMTDPIFDKSDANIWSAAIRASVYYDSSNPTWWHSSELNTAVIMAEIQDAYAHRVFIADNITSFVKDGNDYAVDGDGRFVFAQAGNLTRSQDLIVYDAVQKLPRLKFIIDWIISRFS